MTSPSEEITPGRLVEAADACLQAVSEVADDLNGSYVHPPRLMGTTIQPACLREYTSFEVQQATDFLVRLGLLPDHFLIL